MEIIFIASIFLGLIPAKIAQGKGRSFFLWWFYGAFLFLFAFIHSLFIKPTEASLLEGGMKKCPFCAEIIKPDAIVCRFCGRDLPSNFKAPNTNEVRSNKETAMRMAIYISLMFGLMLIFLMIGSVKG